MLRGLRRRGSIRSISAVMRMLKCSLLVLTFVCSAALAADSTPTEASIKQLFEVMKARKLFDDQINQMDAQVKSCIREVVKGETVTREDQEFLDKMQAKIVLMAKEEMRWEKWEPVMMRIYRESLTQEEVDGLIAFYGSPAGKALVSKMPLITKSVMAEVQPVLVRMGKEIGKAVGEGFAQVGSRANR